MDFYEDFIAPVAAFLIIVGVIALFIVGLVQVRFPNVGEHVGYVTAVDTGMFCTTVFFKTDGASTQEDTYILRKDDESIESLKEALTNKSNIKISYENIPSFRGWCSENIVKVEKVK